MRSIKTLAATALLATSFTTLASAQSPRPFRDSWFWGLHTGALTYYGANAADPTLAGSSSVAPIVGADWLITRTNGGLYVSFSQAFLSTTGVILNGPTSADTGLRSVSVDGLRRVDFLGMLYPGSYIRFHPYVGFGVSFRYLSSAVANGPYTTQKQIDYATSAVNDVKASLGPALMLGAQYRTKFASVFGQMLVSSMSKDFLLANGHSSSVSMEFGLRYNIGSSVER